MTHLYLIRHADYTYELDGDRKRDLGLSADGLAQAERLRDRLVQSGELKPDVYICSTERGARETAEMLRPALGEPHTFDPDIEEWRSEDGTMDTDEFMGLWKQTPRLQKPFLRFMSGHETAIEFMARAESAFNRIIHEHAGQNILLITHGGVIQTSFAYFFGYGLATMARAGAYVKNTSITHWFKSDDIWILERSNDYSHLNAVEG